MGLKDIVLYTGVSLSLLLGVATTVNIGLQKSRIEFNQELIEYIGKESWTRKDASWFAGSINEDIAGLKMKLEEMTKNSAKETKGMIVEGLKGSPGEPSADLGSYSEIDRLLPKKTEGAPGGCGFGDLFDGPGSQESGKKKDSAYEHIQESLKRSWEYIRQIRENIREGRKAVREANDLLRAGSKGGLDVPDVPVMPKMPVIPRHLQEERASRSEYRRMLQNYQRVIQYFARLRSQAKEGMETLEKGLQSLREGKVPNTPDYQPVLPREDKKKEGEGPKEEEK